MLIVKCSYLSVLLLLCLWFDRCESLTDSSLPVIFYPFGTDQGDSVVTVGDGNCDGPIEVPYEIFNYTSLYVSYTCHGNGVANGKVAPNHPRT